METYDLVVIGGGSGGLTSAIMAGEIGARVLLVDKERFGGDCTWHGCVPSKAVIASARAAASMRRAGDLGIQPTEPVIDFGRVMGRVRAVREGIAAGETPDRLAHHGVDSAFGGATFLDPHRIRIGTDREVRADKVIIATGSEPAPPPIDGLSRVSYLDNRNLFELTELPARLVVVGAGPIGCEMGQAFRRLGAEVVILEMGGQILSREDPEISAVLLDRLRAEGVDVRLHAGVVRVEPLGRGARVFIESDGTASHLDCDALLVAVGRRATTQGLGLDAAGVALTPQGAIAVSDTLQTSQPHIYAVGDCNGGAQFTHLAEYEARIATRNALFRGWENRSLARIPWVTFTEPEVARCGLTAAEAGPGAHVHCVPFTKVDRAVASGDAEGLLKVVVDANDRILGVHIVGAEAGELLPEWVLAMDHGLSLSQIGAAIHAYPTRVRVNRRAADEAFFSHNIAGWKKTLFGTYRGR